MVVLLSLNGVAAGVLPVSKTAEIKRTLTSVAALEVAAKAALIVDQAPKEQRQEISIEVVRIVAAKKVSVLPAVVGAIAKISPENSAAIASEAASLSPEQAESIANAAASAAPAQAAQIAAHVAKATPKNAVQVARSVASRVPEATGEIQENVAVSVPSSRTALQEDETLVRYSRSSATSSIHIPALITTFRGSINGIPARKPPARIPAGLIEFGYDAARDDYGRP